MEITAPGSNARPGQSRRLSEPRFTCWSTWRLRTRSARYGDVPGHPEAGRRRGEIHDAKNIIGLLARDILRARVSGA